MLVLFCVIPIVSWGQYGILNYGGARGLSMGNLGVTFKDAGGQYLNPAMVAYAADWEADLSAERRFEDSGINQFGLSLTKNLKSLGGLGLVIQQVGVESFNQTKVGVSYGRMLNDDFAVGVQFNAHQIRIDEYGSKSVLNASIGLMGKITDRISMGFSIINPIPTDLVEGEETPLTLIIGADYKPTDKVTVIAEIEKDVDFPVNVKMGVEYLPINRLALRLGVNSEPTAINFGAGFQISKNLWINAAAGYSQELGLSPGLGLGWR